MIKMENDVLLKVNNLSKSFMGLKAVDSLSLEVPKNSVIGLIGPNGAGKSTVFNLITKLYDYDNGDIYFEHHCINNLKSHQVAKLGVARTFQNIRLYNNLSVLENVIVALDTDFDYNMLHVLTNSKKYKDIEEWKINKACELLKMTEGLYEMRFQKAHSLSYGAQRKLEIIR
ncbi:MAG: ABC transporter ATP-binding protein, partial [Thermoanaerobacterales bacterium]|nr:ABC transporter ATP-binding protein [Thermoanaerobacterales bacterium]